MFNKHLISKHEQSIDIYSHGYHLLTMQKNICKKNIYKASCTAGQYSCAFASWMCCLSGCHWFRSLSNFIIQRNQCPSMEGQASLLNRLPSLQYMKYVLKYQIKTKFRCLHHLVLPAQWPYAGKKYPPWGDRGEKRCVYFLDIRPRHVLLPHTLAARERKKERSDLYQQFASKSQRFIR